MSSWQQVGHCPGWAVGMSIFGTYLSSNTFLGNPGKAYGGNFNGYLFTLSLPLAVMDCSQVLRPVLSQKRTNFCLPASGRPFWLVGSHVRHVVLPAHPDRSGWNHHVWSSDRSACTERTGMSRPSSSSTGLLVTLYTLLGGIEAVIWTDVVQSIVLMGGALLIFGMLIFSMPEGPYPSLDDCQECWKNGTWQLGLSIPHKARYG